MTKKIGVTGILIFFIILKAAPQCVSRHSARTRFDGFCSQVDSALATRPVSPGSTVLAVASILSILRVAMLLRFHLLLRL